MSENKQHKALLTVLVTQHASTYLNCCIKLWLHYYGFEKLLCQKYNMPVGGVIEIGSPAFEAIAADNERIIKLVNDRVSNDKTVEFLFSQWEYGQQIPEPGQLTAITERIVKEVLHEEL